jgi:two-component system response regulator TctD
MARVLVAEDEAFTALAVVEELEIQGHVVAEARDGADAIARLRDFQPDVLVTDLMMPEVDGAALIRHLRAAMGASVAVILITGVPEAKLPQDISYDAYLGKPVDYSLLSRTIGRLTGAPPQG